MDKKIGIIITFIVTMIFNILAPILLINTVRDYSAKSEIVGSPSDEIVISNYVSTSDYVFQENLSKINYVIDEESGYYLYSYYFSAKEFDATKNNYGVFINDYMCGITALQPKAITCTYTMAFKDINKDVLNTLDIEITFEFYSSYSYLLLKIDTEDITYFNGFRENPGFVLTLSKVDYGMSGLIGQSSISDITETCKVTYVVDNITYFNTAVVTGTTLSALPTNPLKSGYIFKGWSLDGVNTIDVTAQTISEDTIFIAVFELITTAETATVTYDYNYLTITNISDSNATLVEDGVFTCAVGSVVTLEFDRLSGKDGIRVNGGSYTKTSSSTNIITYEVTITSTEASITTYTTSGGAV